ncbi:hypothetical protein RND81_01G004900 [Saponaria officinalis]|uniref:Thioredoxin domain-containing protein n=1 Tax=Saponaria officinalis TaxID=3572 RepID=A0AAW1NF27_SAPOF
MPITVSLLNVAACQFIDNRIWHSRLSTCSMSCSLAINGVTGFSSLKMGFDVKHRFTRCVNNENNGYLGDGEEDDDDELCPVECVREFYTDEEFTEIIEKAKQSNSLVVVDFYRTSCGSCKYIEQGFSKLCKASGDDDVPVIFLKHNVLDEYDEQSEVAERLRIKKVPLFHFYKNGILLEAFATRDKERITEAIAKYTSPVSRHDDDSN